MQDVEEKVLPPDTQDDLPMPSLLHFSYPSERNYSVPDDKGFYHVADMRYNEHQYKLFFGTKEEKEMARNAHPSPSTRWPNGVVPYKYHSGVTNWQRNRIEKCMADFNYQFKFCLNVR